ERVARGGVPGLRRETFPVGTRRTGGGARVVAARRPARRERAHPVRGARTAASGPAWSLARAAGWRRGGACGMMRGAYRSRGAAPLPVAPHEETRTRRHA